MTYMHSPLEHYSNKLGNFLWQKHNLKNNISITTYLLPPYINCRPIFQAHLKAIDYFTTKALPLYVNYRPIL